MNWARLTTIREPVALATVIGVDGSAPRQAGARMLVYADGRIEGTVGGGNFEYRVIAAAKAVLADRKPRRFAVHLTRDLGMCCGGAMEVYIEPILPTPLLVVYGAGHVAQPTAALAVSIGFSVTVVDEREEFAAPERFPGCDIVCGDGRRHARAQECDERTHILIVTHDHALDQDLLEILLAKPWGWCGLIGSRAKIAKFYLRLRAAGADDALFPRVSAPVGLDVGAETPEEIAISIAAELVACRRGRTGVIARMSAGGLTTRKA